MGEYRSCCLCVLIDCLLIQVFCIMNVLLFNLLTCMSPLFQDWSLPRRCHPSSQMFQQPFHPLYEYQSIQPPIHQQTTQSRLTGCFLPLCQISHPLTSILLWSTTYYYTLFHTYWIHHRVCTNVVYIPLT